MLLMHPSMSVADRFTWGNTTTNRVTYAGGGGLAYSRTDASVGCLAQLIYAGGDGLPNPAVPSGTGVTGDDTVITNSWFGRNAFGDQSGVVPSQSDVTAVSGQVFYVRSWTAPAADFSSGQVPTSTTNRYVDSDTYVFPGGGTGIEHSVVWNFGGTGLVANAVPNADTDADSLPDWWEFLYFQSITNASSTADGDDDGSPNAHEYAAGTVPTNGASVFALDTLEHQGASWIVSWSSVTGRTYQVGWSSNLNEAVNWQGASVLATGTVSTWSGEVSVRAPKFAVGVE